MSRVVVAEFVGGVGNAVGDVIRDGRPLVAIATA
jgi:hypothetical protein